MNNDVHKNNGVNAYAQHNAYAHTDAYAKKDPYAKKDDPYAKDNEQYAKNEKKRPWQLDFEVVRIFREGFNSGVDFDETPRVFYDEEEMLSLRLKLLTRNTKTIILKFITMVLFSIGTLFMTLNGLIIIGGIYLLMFLYFIGVPMAFVKYTRQYIAVDDPKRGKLKKIHNTYSRWMKPLESIAMNSFTIFFVFIEMLMYFNSELIIKYISQFKEHIPAFINKHITYINVASIENSILITTGFYLFAYFAYWLLVYKILTPKYEAIRKENELSYRRSNQRKATSLKSTLSEMED